MAAAGECGPDVNLIGTAGQQDRQEDSRLPGVEEPSRYRSTDQQVPLRPGEPVSSLEQPAGLIEHGLDQGDAGPPLRCGSGECRRPWESSEKDGGSFAYAADGSRVR